MHVQVTGMGVVGRAQAKVLQKLVAKTGLVLGLTHTYTGYPLVKEARAMVASGKFGKIRKVFVEYPQGWLSTLLEGTGNMQASWRTDPKQSGMGGATVRWTPELHAERSPSPLRFRCRRT